MYKLILLVFLTSCSLQYGTHKPSEPFYPVRTVKIYNLGICAEAYIKANQYFSSYGIVVSQSDKSDYAITCIPNSNLFVRILKPIVNLIPEPDGLVYGHAGWVKVTGNTEDDAKIMIHELTHLLFGVGHKATGIMFPFSGGLLLATGLDKGTIEHIINDKKP